MRCEHCGHECEGKFCSNCGSQMEAAAEHSTKQIENKLTLSFGKSTSKNYNIAVERAKKHPTYKETGEDKDITHYITFGFDEIDELRSFLDLVGQWKSTTLYFNNEPIPYSEISGVLYCYSERQRAYKPEEYCFGRDDAKTYNDNDLGCRHCGVNPYNWEGLTEFGEMQKDGTFIVDKDKLIFTVTKNLENYKICPVLDMGKIKRKLRAFPDSINPKTNRQWEYVTDWQGDKEIAISVRKKDPKKGSGYVLKETRDGSFDFEKYKDSEIKISKANKSTASGSGCLLPILLTILVLIWIVWLV